MFNKIVFIINVVWCIAAIILFVVFPGSVLQFTVDGDNVTESTKDCIRMLGPTYLGFTVLSAIALFQLNDPNVVKITSGVVFAVFAANIALEIHWVISGRWVALLGLFMTADALVAILNGIVLFYSLRNGQSSVLVSRHD